MKNLFLLFLFSGGNVVALAEVPTTPVPAQTFAIFEGTGNVLKNISLSYDYAETVNGLPWRDKNVPDKEYSQMLLDIENSSFKSLTFSPVDDADSKSVAVSTFSFSNEKMLVAGGVIQHLGGSAAARDHHDISLAIKRSSGATVIRPMSIDAIPNRLLIAFFDLAAKRKDKQKGKIKYIVKKTAVINGFVIPLEIEGNEIVEQPLPEGGKIENVHFNFKFRIKPETIKINRKLDASIFKVKIPVGSTVIDEIKGVTFVADGLHGDPNQVKLEDALDEMLKEAEGQRTKEPQTKKSEK
jgi:hypothetical protein